MFRICRARGALVAALVGAAAVAGLPGLQLQAGAATTVTGSISAASAPQVASTGSDQAAATLTVTLSAEGTLPHRSLALTATTSTNAGVIDWGAPTVLTYGITKRSASATGDVLDITLGPKTANESAQIDITGITLTTRQAQGEVIVTATMEGVAFSTPSAVVATVESAPPGTTGGSTHTTGGTTGNSGGGTGSPGSGTGTSVTGTSGTGTAGAGTAGAGTVGSATREGFTVSANTPPVTVPPSAYDAQISPFVVSTTSPTVVPAGYMCLALSAGDFDTAADARASVASGDEVVSPTVTFQSTGAPGAAGTAAATMDVTASSTGSGAVTISGLMVDAPSTAGPVTVSVTRGPSASCSEDTTTVGSAKAFTVGQATAVSQIYGPTPDATAAAELEHQFDAEGTNCPGRSGARPVVLATDAAYPDALASAYLASFLQTGELLTPAATLSAATVDAIRDEGITNVYVVGGPLAVSTAVVKQLETTLAYNCGGASPITTAGPVYVQVTRIYGQTQYDTAQWVAEYPTATAVGSVDVAGAFGTTNRTGGMGRYNDTDGTASSAPLTSQPLPTAIIATGRSFQDAEAAGVLSYADHLPILLTAPTALSPEVASAVSALQVKQVVVMGGPLAVSNAVVTALKALGLSVLRIAGQTDTDTAVQLADFEMGPSSGHVGLGWASTERVAVARGNYYTDGLAGAVVAAGASRTRAAEPEPLLLTAGPSTLGPYLTAFLRRAGSDGIDSDTADVVSGLTVLGGPDAVTPTQVRAMRSDL